MTVNRRTFIGAAAMNAAALASLPADLFASAQTGTGPLASSDEWSVDWRRKLSGKHKGVFDNTEVESGYGVWRAAAWARQHMDVLKASMSDITPAIVLRHNAIVLAMQQSFWDKYGIGASKKVMHPLTGEATDRNPVLLGEKDGIPAPFNQASLTNQLSHGVIVLACNLAFGGLVSTVREKEKLTREQADAKVRALLIPGVQLMPSGVFAAMRAQEAGCNYMIGS